MIPRHMQIAFAILLLVVTGMGVYLIRLKARTEGHAAKANAEATLAPASGPESQVTLRIAYDRDGELVSRTVSAALPSEVTERDRAILRLLLAEYKKTDATHHLGPDADVNAVFLLKAPQASADIRSDASGAAGSGGVSRAAFAEVAQSAGPQRMLAVVDLSEALAKSQPSGIMLESLTLESLAQTLHANSPEIGEVRFLVNGVEQETLAGHADLRVAWPAE